MNTHTSDATGVYIANQNGMVTSYLKDTHGNIAAKADSSGAMLLRLLNAINHKDYRRGVPIQIKVNFKKNYINPMLENGIIKMTIPDNPKNRKICYGKKGDKR